MSAWAPFAIRDPGLNANYRRGRCAAAVDVAHETVGRDSRALIRDRGLAQWLVPKDGAPWQFAPDDAACSHACEWNLLGDGIEVERFPGEPMTASQVYRCAQIVKWRHEERGVPLDHWNKNRGRLPIGTGWRGTADHGGLRHVKCDQHTDGWTDAEWSAILAAAGQTGPDPRKATDMEVLLPPYQGTVLAYVTLGGRMLRQLPSEPRGVFGIPKAALDFHEQHEVPLLTVTADEWAKVLAWSVPEQGGAVDVAAFAAALRPVVEEVVAAQAVEPVTLPRWVARMFRQWSRKAARAGVPEA